MKKKLFLFLVLTILVLSGCVIKNEKNYQSDLNNNLENEINFNNNQIKNMPEMTIDQSKNYKAVLNTSEGRVVIQLKADDTPITVNNFVTLARNNFYNESVFHRVIKGFMIQGGDPTGTGSGGPGYKFDDEPFTGNYVRGALAMANAGPNTNGSQFFIMHADYPLPRNYVIFGQVIEGIDVVDKIAEAETVLGADGAISRPTNPVKILNVEIIEE